MLFKCPFMPSLEWAIGAVKLELILSQTWRLKCDGIYVWDASLRCANSGIFDAWFDSHNCHATCTDDVPLRSVPIREEEMSLNFRPPDMAI